MMDNRMQNKSSRDEIMKRFDNDVERFSNLETGQKTVIDAQLCLELITDAAAGINPDATDMLDVGCGAGNYTIKMLQKVAGMNSSLIDLSKPMLQRAQQRVAQQTNGRVNTLQGDILDIALPQQAYDIVVAGAVLHHLRDDADWEKVFANIYQSLKPGGSFWICDLVIHDMPQVEQLFKNNYGAYLETLGDTAFKQHVFDYIEREDTPRSVMFQADMLRRAGFKYIEILHKNVCFAAFGGVK